MLRLRKILLSDYTYIILIIIFLPILLIRLNTPKESIYNSNTKQVEGIIIKQEINTNKNIIYVKSKEEIICYLNNKTNYELGDKVLIIGEFKKNNTNNVNYKVYVNKIKIISKNKNIYYKFKNLLITYLNNNPYLYVFIIGDQSKIKKEVLTSYQANGISHLFAISGMHITLLATILLKLLKKVEENKRYIITSVFLILYLLICNTSASILRAVLFFILFSLNKIYYFYIKPTNIFIVVVIITLLINPNYIFNIGFQYSFSISLSLLLLSNRLSSNNYILSLLKVSITAFIISIPISLYHFNTINLLSIIYNIFYVPFISLVVFPLSLVVLLFKPLLPFYNLLITILETTSMFLNNIKILTFLFPKIPLFLYFTYYLIIILIIKNNKYIILLFLLMLLHYNIDNIIAEDYIEFINIGQGDSILIHSNKENCLIDTGGSSYSKYHISDIVTLPLLKDKGIRKINKMYLTHGDNDHLGEAINIIKNIRVDKVFINSNKVNYNERQIYEYHNNIGKLKEEVITTCGNVTLYQINASFSDENDSSLVLLGVINNYIFLFMGDASINTEKYILNNYDLPKIDVLKVGHHGSKTSTSKEFINTINPKYSIISVGKNNRYGHPNKEVLDNLKDSKIYRTDKDGSIMFKIKNNKLKIETCSP